MWLHGDPPVDRQTDMTENITSPQFCWWGGNNIFVVVAVTGTTFIPTLFQNAKNVKSVTTIHLQF